MNGKECVDMEEVYKLLDRVQSNLDTLIDILEENKKNV